MKQGRYAWALFFLLGFFGGALADGTEGLPPDGTRRVVILGDSITYSGQYVVFLETYWRSHGASTCPEVINMGLPSETLSGLSEPGHAGGDFPRPDLLERLDRVLNRLRPDLVLACYGMNDGIYYPYSDARFQAYRDGINRLRAKTDAAGAKLILLTPPVFDPLPIRERTLPMGRAQYPQPYEGYNQVLDLYSAWLVAERGEGWRVVDPHEPMNRFLAEQRTVHPNFHLAGDGVHLNEIGHWLIAREVLLFLGAPPEVAQWHSAIEMLEDQKQAKEIIALVQKKQRLLSDAWLNEVGHLRPGMSKGLPVPTAEQQAHDLDMQIDQILSR